MPKKTFLYENISLTPRQKEVHPIWRGIGFSFIILIPLISTALSLLLIDINKEKRWLAIPKEFLIDAKDPLLLVKIGLTIVIIFILAAIVLLITFLANRLFGPPRYLPTDVPPEKFHRIKK